jgi:uncharacterized surface protein with fasciclin (FAS1) repeats
MIVQKLIALQRLYIALLLIGLLACSKDPLIPSAPPVDAAALGAEERGFKTILEIIAASGDYSTLLAAIRKTNLQDTFSNRLLDATVLLPTNIAFAKQMPPLNDAANIDTIKSPAAIAMLRQTILYHVFRGRVYTPTIKSGGIITTLKPREKGNDNQIFVAENRTGAILFNGGPRLLTGSNIRAENGVIHLVDNVLFYPTRNMTDLLATNQSLTAFMAGLQKTGLAGLFANNSVANITVFAPTNGAFARLSAPFNNATNINNLIDPDQIETLRRILLYHLVNYRLFAANFREDQQISTLAKKSFLVSVLGGARFKGSANAQFANLTNTNNIHATNGVLHLIDRVLEP